MGYLNGMNRKWPNLEPLIGVNLAQIGGTEQAVLLKFVFHVGQRELRAPHRHVELGQNPWERADMILVAVSENDPLHPLTVLDEVGNIRHHDVDAQQFGFWEHQARVDDDDVVAPAHGHAVHSELAQPAQGHDL